MNGFHPHVDTSGGPDACWPWTGTLSTWGYGRVRVYVDGRRMEMNASRAAYIAANGPIGDLFVLHSCDNPPCCNPKHLRPGTHADNMADRKRRGRYATGEGVRLPAGLVDEIRAAYRPNVKGYGTPTLAARFGVARSVVQRIVTDTSRRHHPQERAS